MNFEKKTCLVDGGDCSCWPTHMQPCPGTTRVCMELHTAKRALEEQREYAERIAVLLRDAGSVLDYWQDCHCSATGDRVRKELLPAIRGALKGSPANWPVDQLEAAAREAYLYYMDAPGKLGSIYAPGEKGVLEALKAALDKRPQMGGVPKMFATTVEEVAAEEARQSAESLLACKELDTACMYQGGITCHTPDACIGSGECRVQAADKRLAVSVELPPGPRGMCSCPKEFCKVEPDRHCRHTGMFNPPLSRHVTGDSNG